MRTVGAVTLPNVTPLQTSERRVAPQPPRNIAEAMMTPKFLTTAILKLSRDAGAVRPLVCLAKATART